MTHNSERAVVIFGTHKGGKPPSMSTASVVSPPIKCDNEKNREKAGNFYFPSVIHLAMIAVLLTFSI